MHIISPLPLLVPAFTLYLLHFKGMGKIHHLMVAFLATIVLLLNSYWLIPLAKFYHQIMPYEFMGKYAPFQIYNLWEPLNVYLKQNVIYSFRPTSELNNSFIEVFLLLFGIVGFYLWISEKKIKLFLPFLLGTLFLFFVGYYGSHTDFFTKLHPQRFLISLNIFGIASDKATPSFKYLSTPSAILGARENPISTKLSSHLFLSLKHQIAATFQASKTHITFQIDNF